MSIAAYSVKRAKDGWSVEHDGELGGSYISKEAAFEAIAMAASNAIKDGHEVRIVVPGHEGKEAALGVPRTPR
ncbi:hypothetical protein DW352_18380 [Pseudolabrys taiwanensis]|uniref:DUF2188 domain-containing protein n=1 Tax=Pseudolabrys taiwanensis TaxID=331696 RepID=A0A345ZZG5_9HYPH|nr:hypothetical protein [Pseudolabrys taiwanensis]AXK82312.1 hypothetical protein DW352_18380 [Pseudolabrys taiwanensis]